MLYIRDTVNEIYSHSAEIRSVSEDASKPIRTLSIRIVSPSATLSNNQIVVNVPNVMSTHIHTTRGIAQTPEYERNMYCTC